MKSFYQNFLADILIIDDQADNLRVLARMLIEKGYKVRKALNTLTALSAIKASHPDLILLDIKMPEIDGYQFCSQIKSEPDIADIPIIFISALDEVFNKVRAFEVGGVDYITKPFHAAEVMARIKSQLTIQKQKQQLRDEIQKRQETEAILYQSRALINSVLNSSLDGIAALQAVRDLDGDIGDFRCILVNPMLTKFVKTTQEELLGKLMLKRFLRKVYLEHLFEEFVELTETGITLQKDIEYWADTGQKWYHFIAVKLGDGFSIIIRDITQIKKLEIQLERLAKLDVLTQIGNRLCFEENFQQQWQLALNNQRPLSVILADIDDFKEYNDCYGPDLGDECLYRVAQAIKRSVRDSSGLIARYRGAEFVIILPEQTESEAIATAESVQQEIKNLKIPQAQKGYISLSLGVATIIPKALLKPNQLVAAADLALYQAKKEGGDRLYIYRESLDT